MAYATRTRADFAFEFSGHSSLACRAIAKRRVVTGQFKTRSRALAPTLAATPAMSLAPARSIQISNFYFETRSLPRSLAPTLVALPSMSRVPRAPF